MLPCVPIQDISLVLDAVGRSVRPVLLPEMAVQGGDLILISSISGRDGLTTLSDLPKETFPEMPRKRLTEFEAGAFMMGASPLSLVQLYSGTHI
mgnify:CR=1